MAIPNPQDLGLVVILNPCAVWLRKKIDILFTKPHLISALETQ